MCGGVCMYVFGLFVHRGVWVYVCVCGVLYVHVCVGVYVCVWGRRYCMYVCGDVCTVHMYVRGCMHVCVSV